MPTNKDGPVPLKVSQKGQKIVKVIPSPYNKPLLKKANLKTLTFGDLHIVEKQLFKYYEKDQSDYEQKACGSCGGWP